jgi:hypothetical protein
MRLTKARLIKTLFCGFLCVVDLSLTLEMANAEPAVQRSDEMEFDARVIQGQRAEGAVYLFQRASRPLPPLLVYRKNYLSSIVTPVFSRETPLGQAAVRGTKSSGIKVGNPSAQELDKKVSGAQPTPVKKARDKSRAKKKSKKRNRRRGRKTKKRRTRRRSN